MSLDRRINLLRPSRIEYLRLLYGMVIYNCLPGYREATGAPSPCGGLSRCSQQLLEQEPIAHSSDRGAPTNLERSLPTKQVYGRPCRYLSILRNLSLRSRVFAEDSSSRSARPERCFAALLQLVYLSRGSLLCKGTLHLYTMVVNGRHGSFIRLPLGSYLASRRIKRQDSKRTQGHSL